MINTRDPEIIDLWLLPLTESSSTHLTGKEIAHLLDPAELKRFKRFKVDSKRQEFLASRLLLRHILCRRTSYSTNNISAISAIPDEMGRPFFYLGDKKLPLFFSLSHTKGFIFCASGRSKEIGCDVEQIRERKYLRQLTEMVFSDSERSLYDSVPETETLHFFYRCWTLKEAYVKAVGQGLRIPLTSLNFSQEYYPKESPRACMVPAKKTQKNVFPNWFFYTLYPTSTIICSLATSITQPQLHVHHLLLENGVIAEAKKK